MFQKVLMVEIEKKRVFAGLVNVFSVHLCEFLDYLMKLRRP